MYNLKNVYGSLDVYEKSYILVRKGILVIFKLICGCYLMIFV